MGGEVTEPPTAPSTLPNTPPLPPVSAVPPMRVAAMDSRLTFESEPVVESTEPTWHR